MGGLWRKLPTVWVNVGGLHAGVFVLKRTSSVYGTTPEDVRSPQEDGEAQSKSKEKQ